MKIRLLSSSGVLPTEPINVNLIDPPIGVYADGSLKTRPPITSDATTVFFNLSRVTVGAARIDFEGVLLTAQTGNQTAKAQRIILHADPTNTDDVMFGPNNVQYLTLAPGTQYLIECPPGTATYLWYWYMTSATPGQKVNVLYV